MQSAVVSSKRLPVHSKEITCRLDLLIPKLGRVLYYHVWSCRIARDDIFVGLSVIQLAPSNNENIYALSLERVK